MTKIFETDEVYDGNKTWEHDSINGESYLESGLPSFDELAHSINMVRIDDRAKYYIVVCTSFKLSDVTVKMFKSESDATQWVQSQEDMNAYDEEEKTPVEWKVISDGVKYYGPDLGDLSYHLTIERL
jgi:hypothetical protein